jgi:hypothetical protein
VNDEPIGSDAQTAQSLSTAQPTEAVDGMALVGGFPVDTVPGGTHRGPDVPMGNLTEAEDESV